MTALDRAVEFRLAAPDADGDGLTLDGYAAVFDQQTEINSWEGTFLEEIRKGAFRKSIREKTPVLQFEHGRHPLVGSLPIGRIDSLSEDDHGLHVGARITDNWVTEPVRMAIADEAITGMSFRFEVVREEWRDNAGKRLTDPAEIQELLWMPGTRGPLLRTLIELRLFELGPVVFPAYEGTSVGVRMAEAVRSADPKMVQTIRGALVADAPIALERDAVLALLTPPDLSFELEERTTDAPPDGHPTEPPAPVAPPTERHPSPSTRAERLQRARRNELALKGVGRKYS